MKNQNNNIENSVDENLTYNNDNQYNDIFSEQSLKSFKIKGKVKYNKEKKEQNEIIVDENENEENEENEEEDDIVQKRVVVENALRNKLFNSGNKKKRNQSAELRNKK